MQSVRLTYFGVEAEGRTLTEARQAAGAKIERCFAEGFGPYIVGHHKYPESFAIVMRADVDSWGYRFYERGKLAGAIKTDPCSCGFASAKDAVAACRRHMAQAVCVPSSDDLTGFEFIESETDRRRHLDWIAWQRDFTRLRGEGRSESEAHAEARSNPDLVRGLTEKWLGAKAA